MAAEIYSENKAIAETIKGKKLLIKQGQDETRLFRIRAGEAYVARETESGVVPLARLEKDDFFGNVPFLDMGHEPYSASIYAAPNLKLGSLDPQALQKEHEKLSSTLQNILGHLATCISVTTLIATDYFKRHFSK